MQRVELVGFLSQKDLNAMLQSHYTRKSSKKNGTQIYAGNRKVGYVRQDTFHKKIKSSGYLKYPRAIAFDIDSLEQAEQAGATQVKIIDSEDGTIYKSTIQNIWEIGTCFNRGWGEQIYLEIFCWETSSDYRGKS